MVDFRWNHWIGFFTWLPATWITQRYIARKLPESDKLIFPIVSLLSGWGLLTIWRLDSYFGVRQTIWLAISSFALIIFLHLFTNLSVLRNYKYLILAGGLLITAATLIFGTNPSGFGPRLWIGGTDIYFQPSEPLKLLLILYLAAYFFDRMHPKPDENRKEFTNRFLSSPIVIPTIVITGVALLILAVQRDLGTAMLFLLIYTIILYLVTGGKRVFLYSIILLALAAFLGYHFIGIIHTRIEVWLNPWGDPSGKSYQIVQSILAIANGGLFGRGIGVGSPTLVPVALSDFIYSSITEETGLLGAVGLLILFNLLITRSFQIALNSQNNYERLLAGGLAAYFGTQSLLIIGGNLRLLPLTGINLPLISYGGSSLLTSYFAIGLLINISNQRDGEPASLLSHIPFTSLQAMFSLGFLMVALATGWWAIIRSPDLLARTDNARRSIADRYVRRGTLFDRKNQIISSTDLIDDIYTRVYKYIPLAPITGYTHPVFGQAGLESTLDGYLRGYQGNPSSLVWWHQLLYGTPPPGLDIRLSLDLDLQQKADELLSDHAGAIILLNAGSGEILSMSSHPTFDPNLLDSIGNTLQNDPEKPLVNRATLGSYPLGSLIDPLFVARFGLDSNPTPPQIIAFVDLLGLYDSPELRLPAGVTTEYGNLNNLHASPLQIILAYSALSNKGIRPAPRITLAVDTPVQGWVIMSAITRPVQVIDEDSAKMVAESLQLLNLPIWQYSASTNEANKNFSWSIAGTLPNWQGTHLTVVVLVETNNIDLANYIGETIITQALEP